jgi:hypothetical protein
MTDGLWLLNQEASRLKQRLIVSVLSVTGRLVSNVVTRTLIRANKFMTADITLPPINIFVSPNPRYSFTGPWRCCCCVGPRKRVYCSLQTCTYPMCVQCSHFHRQEAPRHNDAGDASIERWNLLGKKRRGVWPKVASSTLLSGSFTCRKSTTWDRLVYFLSEGSRAEDFFALKNPTASAGFEHTNLGTKGQHATPRPWRSAEPSLRNTGLV